MKTLLEEIRESGLGYHDWEDGTFLVHYDRNIDDFSVIGGQGNIEVRADLQFYYLDLKDGLGEACYDKGNWDLVSAIADYTERSNH